MYNKSEIMTRAHVLKKEGMSMSAALTQSWKIEKAKVRMDKVETIRFSLSMVDRMSQSQWAEYSALSAEWTQLNNIVNPVVVVEKVVVPLTESEKDALWAEAQEAFKKGDIASYMVLADRHAKGVAA